MRRKIKRIKRKVQIEDLTSLKIKESLIESLAKNLAKQIDKEIFKKKYAPVKDILVLVGAGAFLTASLVIPNLPVALKPFLADEKEYEAWKRFNIPYLKRTLKRLAKQKLVEISEEEGKQIVKITDRGRRKILKYALDELEIEKPKFWDGKWRLLSYDIPKELKGVARIFREYLKSWGFYPLHESVYLHAYPCEEKIEFLREYLGVGEHVRIFTVLRIENDKQFRDFFGI
ncbi:MAG: hypothetical protein ACOZBZ_04185 [Patescibacteria group bacterium]